MEKPSTGALFSGRGQKKDQINLADTYKLKALDLEQRSLSAAAKYYEKALAIYRKYNLETAVEEVRNHLQRVYYNLNDYEGALTISYALLDNYLSENDTLKIAQTYSTIGSLYDNLHQTEKSFEFQQKALDMAVELNSQRGIAALANNLAGLYKDQDSIKKAFSLVRLAEQINTEMGNLYWLSINHMLYADLYSTLGLYDSARYYLDLSNAYTLSSGDVSDSLTMFRKTGIYYLNVDSISLAKDNFNKGILISRRMGNLKAEANFNHWLSELYEKLDDQGNSKHFLQLHYDLLDSARTLKNKEQLMEYEVLYDLQNVEHQLEMETADRKVAEQRSRTNKVRFIGLLIFSIVLLVVGVIIYLLYRKQTKTNRHLLKMNVATVQADSENGKKYAGSNLSEEKKQNILDQLMTAIVDEKIFTDPQLTLESAAEKLNVSRNYLSQVINETYGQSFSVYVNTHRINLAKKYLLSEEYDKYSIEGIANIVGFNSVSAFNTWFKKLTGLPPSYYRKNGRNMMK